MKSAVRPFVSTLWSALLPQNVVLVQAFGLCPILAMGINLRYGVALSVCTVVTLVLTDVLFALMQKRLATRLQPIVYALLSSVRLVGAAVGLRFISAEIYAHLYLFLPLMAVNTLYVYRSAIAKTAHPRLIITLADSLGSALGFSLVLCVASALREMAINGTLWGLSLGYTARFPEAAHPFIGFVLLGFMAATVQWIKNLLRRRDAEEVSDL